jgi:hypothetical protein
MSDEAPYQRHKRIREEYGRQPSDYDGATLKRLTEEPILDAARAFCPAGRLTEAQMRAHEARQVLK